MADVNELEEQIKVLVPKVAADQARQNAALAERDQAEAEALVRIVEFLRPALPSICGKVGDRRGFQLIDGKGETVVYEDGSFDEEPVWLVRNFSLVRMLETIVKRLESQGGREKAARQAEYRTAKVRALLKALSS